MTSVTTLSRIGEKLGGGGGGVGTFILYRFDRNLGYEKIKNNRAKR